MGFFSNSSYLPQCADYRSGWSSGSQNTLIGFGLVLIASVGICGALNIQKVVHIRNQDPISGEPRANFTRMPLWWVGMLLNTASELVRASSVDGVVPCVRCTRPLPPGAGEPRCAWVRAGHSGDTARMHHRRAQLRCLTHVTRVYRAPGLHVASACARPEFGLGLGSPAAALCAHAARVRRWQ